MSHHIISIYTLSISISVQKEIDLSISLFVCRSKFSTTVKRETKREKERKWTMTAAQETTPHGIQNSSSLLFLLFLLSIFFCSVLVCLSILLFSHLGYCFHRKLSVNHHTSSHILFDMTLKVNVCDTDAWVGRVLLPRSM